MEPPALGALDVVLAAASETAMVLHALHRDWEDVLTAAAAAPKVLVTAAVAPPVLVTAVAGAVGAAPRPLLLGNGVVVAMVEK